MNWNSVVRTKKCTIQRCFFFHFTHFGMMILWLSNTHFVMLLSLKIYCNFVYILLISMCSILWHVFTCNDEPGKWNFLSVFFFVIFLGNFPHTFRVMSFAPRYIVLFWTTCIMKLFGRSYHPYEMIGKMENNFFHFSVDQMHYVVRNWPEWCRLSFTFLIPFLRPKFAH